MEATFLSKVKKATAQLNTKPIDDNNTTEKIRKATHKTIDLCNSLDLKRKQVASKC